MARHLITITIVLLVAACAEPAPPTLAAGSVEAALPASIWPDAPALVRDVECPGLVVDLVAQSVVCTVTLDADPVTVDVEIDETGVATASVREPLFVVAEAATELVRRLEEDLSITALTASCVGTVVVPEDGRSLDCEATDGARTIPFRLEFGTEADDLTLELTGS